eukprot:scaffold27692_cov18-Tisochrysis_lutea.AAC.1
MRAGRSGGAGIDGDRECACSPGAWEQEAPAAAAPCLLIPGATNWVAFGACALLARRDVSCGCTVLAVCMGDSAAGGEAARACCLAAWPCAVSHKLQSSDKRSSLDRASWPADGQVLFFPCPWFKC